MVRMNGRASRQTYGLLVSHCKPHTHTLCCTHTKLMYSRYHFVTGKFPFGGESVYKLFSAIAVGVFDMPVDLSPRLTDLLSGMLCKEADNRFTVPEIRQHS